MEAFFGNKRIMVKTLAFPSLIGEIGGSKVGGIG
jgi:hypothetical protein